ncbi:MAG: response regulator [Anaerolineae bacterium]|nr:response regulator [Anaerolineae bacterium]
MCVDWETASGYLAQTPELPTLILLDLNMPRISGLDILRFLKREHRLHHIPVVILTTSDQVEDQEQAHNLRAAGYIVKPLAYARFVEAMRAIEQYWSAAEQRG